MVYMRLLERELPPLPASPQQGGEGS